MTVYRWGYERPDCIGDHALALFIDDIQRVLDEHAHPHGDHESRRFELQADVNRLLQAYAENARRTTAFNGQFIEIRAIEPTDRTPAQWLPVFSPGLRQALSTLLKRSQNTPTH